MARNDRTVPCIGNHMFVIHILPAILNKRSKDPARLRPQSGLHTVAHKAAVGQVDEKRSNFNFFYRNTHTAVSKFDDFLSTVLEVANYTVRSSQLTNACANVFQSKRGRCEIKAVSVGGTSGY